MSGAIDIKIEGLEQLRDKLRNLGADVSKSLEAAGTKGMLVLEADIKRRAPVRTGELRDSYTTEAKTSPAGVEVTTGTNKKYAPYLEYGTGIYAEGGDGRKTPWTYINEDGEKIFTHGSHPHPHVRPAIDATKNQVIETVTAELGHEIMRRRMG
jgi:HK97 gp10 family phage protein